MFQYHASKQRFAIIFLMLIFAGLSGHTQKQERPQPKWWFGASGAANFNFYRGMTQVLNSSVTVPTPFHNGNGVRPYASLLTEYRINKFWGVMLNAGYDNRGGKFDDVIAPCNCPATLSTNISYFTIEPSIRIAPFSSSFYLFVGHTLNFNIAKEFKYTQEKQTDKKGDWSNIDNFTFSGQAGAGIDLPISSRTSSTQVTLSPFVSFLTDLGHEPRKVESWSFYTIRTGIALKFGKAKKSASSTTAAPEPVPEPVIVKAEPVITPPVVIEKEVQFSVRGPKPIVVNRKETFPISNTVFFDMGSAEIPTRYVTLSQQQATSFNEGQLNKNIPDDLDKGRSSRQLAVYHNILNILGDRMRANPQSSIALSGAADKNPKEGKLMAENIKQYLVTVFGIDASRISTAGRDKPLIPSEQPGGTKELDLLREGDHRVDITSKSPELLMQVGGNSSAFLKPVQITGDPLDSHVVFNNTGADELLKSWSLEVTDEQGKVQNYGPYTTDQASVPGNTILGSNTQGNYKVVMLGETKSGHSVKKESSVNLVKGDDIQLDGSRYSVLFDFDKSKTIASYEKFLTDVVAPLITDNATVIIYGHTDIIGEEKYNATLSRERATGTQQILERALSKAGKKGVKFETNGFGEDVGKAPFENNLPEERFYNRTVIIDIVPVK